MAEDDRYFCGLPDLAIYSGFSVSALQRYLKDPERPIPHARIGARVMVRRSDFDAWVAEARVTAKPAALKVREAYQRSQGKPVMAWARKLRK